MPSTKSIVQKAFSELVDKDRVEKADQLVGDFGPQFALTTQSAQEFIKLAIEKSELLPLLNKRSMPMPSWSEPRIGFTGQVLRPTGEGMSASYADRSTPEMSSVTFNCKKVTATYRTSWEVLEDNIEQGNLKKTIMDGLAEAASRDLEKLILLGDNTIVPTNDLERLFATFDGILKQASSNVVNRGGVRLDKSTFRALKQTLPSQYLTPQHIFMVSKNSEIDLVDSVANRQTQLGDGTLASGNAPAFFGHKVAMIPNFPETLGVSANTTNVLFLDPKNVKMGFCRDIKVYEWEDVDSEMWSCKVTMRLDVKIMQPNGVAKATNVLATPFS